MHSPTSAWRSDPVNRAAWQPARRRCGPCRRHDAERSPGSRCCTRPWRNALGGARAIVTVLGDDYPLDVIEALEKRGVNFAVCFSSVVPACAADYFMRNMPGARFIGWGTRRMKRSRPRSRHPFRMERRAGLSSRADPLRRATYAADRSPCPHHGIGLDRPEHADYQGHASRLAGRAGQRGRVLSWRGHGLDGAHEDACRALPRLAGGRLRFVVFERGAKGGDAGSPRRAGLWTRHGRISGLLSPLDRLPVSGATTLLRRSRRPSAASLTESRIGHPHHDPFPDADEMAAALYDRALAAGLSEAGRPAPRSRGDPLPARRMRAVTAGRVCEPTSPCCATMRRLPQPWRSRGC